MLRKSYRSAFVRELLDADRQPAEIYTNNIDDLLRWLAEDNMQIKEHRDGPSDW